jgi:hypothetical protein
VPRIEFIPEIYYQPNDPIHWEVDNLPLKAIIARQELINLALDDVIEQMRDAIGTQGSLANRLNQSIEENGGLKATAIDTALHSIEEHEDTDDYVRMTKDQSEKLDLIADEATNVSLQVYTDETTFTEFTEGVVEIHPSSTVVPSIEAPNIIKFDMVFPAEAAHRHYYGLEPVSADIVHPDYLNYKVNSIASPFIEGSLRVHINGVRVFEDVEVYVPGALVDDPWTLMSVTPDHEAGTFELSAAITEYDAIRVDFDIVLD